MKTLLIVMGLSILFHSCTQDELTDIESNSILSAELENVANQYEVSLKDEQTPTTELETFASEEDIKAIQDSLRLLSTSYTSSKTKASAYEWEPASPKVGVFKVSTCGSYREFIYRMDCEDGGSSNVQGNVGATYIDGSKNVVFYFCVVPAADYNGATLLLTTFNYGSNFGNVDVVERYHDNEDTKNKNEIINDAGGALNIKAYPGNCSFSANTVFSWRFSESKNGTLPFQYGVLTNSFSTEDGKIFVDDQNQGNSNTARLWRHTPSDPVGSSRLLTTFERFRGISHSQNTTYHIKINNN